MWFLVIMGGLAISLTCAMLLEDKNLGGWMLAVFTLPIACSFVFAWLNHNRLVRQRLARLAALFESRGIKLNPNPSGPQRRNFYEPISFLTDWMGLQNGADSIEWLATSQTVAAFEHIFVTGAGRNVQEHLETVIIVPSPIETHGGMTARRAGYSLKRVWRNSESRFEIGDPEFDGNWVLLGNPDIARWFLITQVRQILADAPAIESWIASNHYICLSVDGTLDAKAMAVCLDRALSVAKTIDQNVPLATPNP